MEIRSIIVNVGLGGRVNALNYAVGLAQQFGAELIGVAAAEPHLAVSGVDGAQIAADYYTAERATIESLLGQAEERFRATVIPSEQSKWRGSVADTTNFLIDEARRCDLLVTADGDIAGVGEALDLGHLILSCGRPVLVVADGEGAFRLGNAAVAWKDTREARRALSDALPLLQRTDHVKVVTHSEDDSVAEAASLEQVVAWLSLHGVHAESKLIEHGADFLEQLGATSNTGGPDLVVSGGYGHSRFREWLFGGVTKDLLDAKNVNRLFSN
jgi:nucleotide-binding universal stress UspA family protein